MPESKRYDKKKRRIYYNAEKKIPSFKNEEDEQKFWKQNDSYGYIDWERASIGSFVNHKPALRYISIRLPEIMWEKIRILANKRDVPYQSLIKTISRIGLTRNFPRAGKNKKAPFYGAFLLTILFKADINLS